MTGLTLEPLHGIPAVRAGDELAALILDAAQRAELRLAGGVLVVCQKIVSKAEGRVVALAEVEPRDEAREIARDHGMDPRHTELVRRERARSVRQSPVR